MTTLVFDLPDENTPGFLRRQRRALELRQNLLEDPKPELIDEMAVFLSPYVSQPEDPKEKAEALMDASQAQLTDLLNAIAGLSKDGNPTEP